MSLLYDGYVKTLSEKFERRLDDISVEYNFELGDEFEVAICEILRSFLPNRYGICRGFVVNAKGDKKGDDIIIYDQETFPTLKINPKNQFSRLESIPIEAVYAYIEAKHTLDSDTYDKAIKQTMEVKNLCSQREKRDVLQYDNYIKAEKIRNMDNSLPNHRNPIFTMILSRHSISRHTNKKSDNPDDIHDFLCNKYINNTTKDFLPDLIVVGGSNIVCPAYDNNGVKTIAKFYLENNPSKTHLHLKKSNIAFGMGLVYLITALDFINLGRMPWEDIINNAKNN